MPCEGESWRSYGEEPKPFHDLEDSHVVNIIRYLKTKRVENFLRKVADNKVRDMRRYYTETIAKMEKEAKRRGLDLEEIDSTYQHPDPYEVYREKRKEEDADKS